MLCSWVQQKHFMKDRRSNVVFTFFLCGNEFRRILEYCGFKLTLVWEHNRSRAQVEELAIWHDSVPVLSIFHPQSPPAKYPCSLNLPTFFSKYSFPKRRVNKLLYAYIVGPKVASCPVHSRTLDCTALTIPDDLCTSWGSRLLTFTPLKPKVGLGLLIVRFLDLAAGQPTNQKAN
jgi:hypothetical protein